MKQIPLPHVRRMLAIGGASLGLIFSAANATADDPVAFPPETNATTIAEGARSPKLVKRVEPVPPPECATLKHEQRVFIAFVVDSKGRVQNASAMFGPPPALAQAALEAVQQWEFEPALHPFANGTKLLPVNAQMTVLIHFKPAAANEK